MLREASDETVAARESGVRLAQGSRRTEDPRPCARGPETSQDQCRKEHAEDPGQHAAGVPTLVSGCYNLLNQSPCRCLFSLLNQDLGPTADWKTFMGISPLSIESTLQFHVARKTNFSFTLGRNNTHSLISLNVL